LQNNDKYTGRKKMFAKFGPIVMGIPLLLLGVMWIFAPEMAAENLSSELLAGAALTTQIGDSAAFFLGSGFLLIAGGLRANATLILTGGCLVGAVAPARLIAATVHGGDMTVVPIVVEIITFIVAYVAARQLVGSEPC
jgi:hypothetical protein